MATGWRRERRAERKRRAREGQPEAVKASAPDTTPSGGIPTGRVSVVRYAFWNGSRAEDSSGGSYRLISVKEDGRSIETWVQKAVYDTLQSERRGFPKHMSGIFSKAALTNACAHFEDARHDIPEALVFQDVEFEELTAA